jgi:hypothetical protein
MKIFAEIAAAVLTLLAGMFGLNTAFNWLNQPSNVAVFAGVVMLLGVAGGLTAVALGLTKYVRKAGVLLALVMRNPALDAAKAIAKALDVQLATSRRKAGRLLF